MSMHAALLPQSKVPATAVGAFAPLRDETRALCNDERTVRELIDRLCEQQACEDAVAVIACVLPRPYAVAWACECFRADEGEPPPADAAVLSTVERWLREPTEAHRARAAELAERLGFEGAAAWLAAAAGWTGGSLAPAGQPEVAPGERLTAEGVTAALRLLAAREPEQYEARLQGYVQRALQTFGGADAESGP